MTTTKPTLLRLRHRTVSMLKAAVAQSAHRSMASLADEILEKELSKRMDKHGEELDRLIEAARKVR
jgi:hypothetical protein